MRATDPQALEPRAAREPRSPVSRTLQGPPMATETIKLLPGGFDEPAALALGDELPLVPVGHCSVVRPDNGKTPKALLAAEFDWCGTPKELLLSVACSLDSHIDLLALALANQAFRHLAECEEAWRALCVRRFGTHPGASPPSWKDLYKYNHELLYKHVLVNRVDVLRDLRFRFGRSTRLNLPALA